MLTWQCRGLGVWGILVHRHPAAAAATGKELPRRSELAGHRNGERGSALGAGHCYLGFPGLLMGRPRGSSTIWGKCCRRPGDPPPVPRLLHPASRSLQARSPAPTSRRRRPGPGWQPYAALRSSEARPEVGEAREVRGGAKEVQWR